MHPPSVPLDNLLVRFSKMFLNPARHLKLTQSLNVGLNWDTNQLRRTRSHSNGIGNQLSTRLYSVLSKPSRLARIMTAAQGHSGDWITAYSIAQVGNRLDDRNPRISVALRVGLNVSLANQCRCGATVQSDGLHPLSCRFSAGRFSRHFAINNIIKRTIDNAGLHSILELVGLDRGDGKRPDEVTPFLLKGGKALAWDATCTDSFSASNLYSTVLNAGSAPSAAEDLKRRKYYQLVADFEFVPVAVETSGIIGSAGCSTIIDIGCRTSRATNDPRHMSYIFQQISSIIRGNALAIKPH